MKLFAFIAAGLVGVAGLAPTALVAPAAAQRTVVTERTVVRHYDDHHGRPHWRTVCRTEWRHHHRVRICRKVRG